MSMSQLKTASQLDELLADAYDRQPTQFIFDLAILLLQGKDLNAAKAAVSADITANRSDRSLELVFDEVADLLSVRKHTDLLASMADVEHLSEILLRLKCGQGRTPISPKMLERTRQQRKKPMNLPIIPLPGIQIAQTRLSLPLINVINDFIENPDWACGVVELSTQRQLIVTEASAKMILRSDFDRLIAAGEEHEIRERVAAATNLKREDYFYPPDLLEFMRMTRRDLEPNNPSSKQELTWRGQSRDGTWVRYTHEYRLIMGDLNEVYHVGRNVGYEAIAEPEPAIA